MQEHTVNQSKEINKQTKKQNVARKTKTKFAVNILDCQAENSEKRKKEKESKEPLMFSMQHKLLVH